MIEQQIYNALKDLCNGQVYPLIAEEKAVAPYIIYTPISDVKSDTLCGIASSTHVTQVDAYHPDFEKLPDLKDAIIEKLSDLPIFNVNARTSYESETKLYRIMIEVSIID